MQPKFSEYIKIVNEQLLGVELSEDLKESHFRNVSSRIYYDAFHKVRQFLVNFCEYETVNVGAHSNLLSFLNSLRSKNGNFGKIRHYLSEMRDLRENADYNPKLFSEPPVSSLKRLEQIDESLRKLKKTICKNNIQ